MQSNAEQIHDLSIQNSVNMFGRMMCLNTTCLIGAEKRMFDARPATCRRLNHILVPWILRPQQQGEQPAMRCRRFAVYAI